MCLLSLYIGKRLHNRHGRNITQPTASFLLTTTNFPATNTDNTTDQFPQFQPTYEMQFLPEITTLAHICKGVSQMGL